MEIIWKEVSDLLACGGHGINFFADEEGTPDKVIAALRGFAWLHGHWETVEISIRPPDELYDVAFLAEAKRTIQQYFLLRPMPLQAWLSPTVYVHVNG